MHSGHIGIILPNWIRIRIHDMLIRIRETHPFAFFASQNMYKTRTTQLYNEFSRIIKYAVYLSRTVTRTVKGP
jgi:hypothetical protein